MARRYIAFDIEIAKDCGEDFNWQLFRPVGISCAATSASNDEEPLLWHGKTPSGQPAERMGPEDAKDLAQYLAAMIADGYTLLTWNGASFDLDILAEESGLANDCKEFAFGHVDMMFHVVCALGHWVGLDKAARGMGLPGKTEGMTGAEVPKLWAEGRHQEILDYVAQDVRTTLRLAQVCENRRIFEWITRKGTKRSMPLSNGWLTIREALELPEPDTSWMSDPPARRDLIAWALRI